jgi:hypothetical protein
MDGVSLARVTLVDQRGEFVRSILPPVPPPPEPGTSTGRGGGSPFPIALSAAGWIVEREFRPGLAVTANWIPLLRENELGYVFVSASGSPSKLIAALPGFVQQCGRTAFERIHCPRIITTTGADGRSMLVLQPVSEGREAGSVRVTSIAHTGDTAFARLVVLPPIPIAKQVLDSIRARGVASSRSPAEAARWRSAKLRTNYPPFGHAPFVGRDGTIWIGLRKTAAGNPWLILNPDGTEFGRLIVAANVWITAGTRTHFWGTESDEDGIESIVRYRLVR